MRVDMLPGYLPRHAAYAADEKSVLPFHTHFPNALECFALRTVVCSMSFLFLR